MQWRRYAGKVVDIKKIKKNPNPGFFIFPLCVCVCVCVCVVCGGEEGGGGGRQGQGEVLAGEWEQLFSYVTYCINLIHIAFNFHQDIPWGYQVMDGWMTCNFTSFSTVFQSYKDDGRLTMLAQEQF